jgi:hypothetical protein
MVQDVHDVGIAGHDPGMQKRVPVHWILGSQTAIEWVGVGKHLWVEEVIKAQLGLR